MSSFKNFVTFRFLNSSNLLFFMVCIFFTLQYLKKKKNVFTCFCVSTLIPTFFFHWGKKNSAGSESTGYNTQILLNLNNFVVL